VPFFERFVRPNVLHETPDEERVRRTLAEELPPVLDYLEGQVTGDEGIVGGRFSIADVALCSPLATLQDAAGPIDAARWPWLAGYVGRVLGRPSFTRALAPAVAAA